MYQTRSILHWPRRHLQASRKNPAGLTIALLAAALLTLSGCETVPGERDGADTRYAETRAQRMVRAGQHEQAAELYEQLAETAADPDRFWLAAARENYSAGRWPDVIRSLERITGVMGTEDATERALLGASASLSMDDISAAEKWLSDMPETVSDRARPSWLWVRIRLALAGGNVEQAIALTTERELWLSRPEDVRAGRQALLEAMESQHRLTGLPAEDAFDDPLIAGWLSLAKTLAEADRDPFLVRSALTDWHQRFPEHPADVLLPGLLDDYRRQLDYPRQIAVLLPLSGRLQAAGDAVRDGLMAAYLRHAEERPVVRFYDVNQQDVVAVYSRAMLEGADLVIGPLTRESVLTLAQTGSLPVPALALNNLPEGMSGIPGLYQFGLAPEEEARQAARRLLEDGLVQGIALTPANEWGRRMLEAFASELENAGGILLDYQDYPPRDEDFSLPITTILHLAESRQRHRALSSILGRRIEFEPRRRQDLQFIFLAATADVGRLMRPQFRFHYASNIPVYATSAIYEPPAERNGDLNGVLFDDIPWSIDDNPELVALREELASLWPDGMRAWPRLYALGFDAYRLVPALFSGRLLEEQSIRGLTGDLSLALDGRVRRELMWARFERGVPVLLQAPEPPDAPADETPP